MRHILKDSFMYIFDDFQIILQKNYKLYYYYKYANAKWNAMKF